MRIRRFKLEDMDQTVVLYQKCFAEAPWFEVHDPDEIREMLEHYSDRNIRPSMVIYVCVENECIIGGAIGYHLCYKPAVYKTISETLEKRARKRSWNEKPSHEYKGVQDAFYFAELFVESSARGRGIGKALIKKRLAFACKRGYVKGVVRTSLDQKVIQHLYKDQLGFKEVARQALLAKKLIDGVEEELAYTSVIMVGTIQEEKQILKPWQYCGGGHSD